MKRTEYREEGRNALFATRENDLHVRKDLRCMWQTSCKAAENVAETDDRATEGGTSL